MQIKTSKNNLKTFNKFRNKIKSKDITKEAKYSLNITKKLN